MFKAVFFDIDGTLLSHTISDVPKSARLALDMLKERGIKRVVASGRHIHELKVLATKDISFDGYVCLNGQLCLDENEQIIFERPLEEIDAILEIFNNKSYPCMLIERGGSYINFVNDAVRSAVAEISTAVPPIGEYTGNALYQAIVFVNKEHEAEVTKDLGQFEITRWNKNAIDIVSKGASKVQGIEAYLQHEGIAVSESAAFGDGENDMAMLKFVGAGVAMGNAIDELKEAADYVTVDIDNDGLKKGLEHIGIL